MATMRLRFIHSCMVLTVVGLLVVYSAFLTSPSYDDAADSGDAPIVNNAASVTAAVAAINASLRSKFIGVTNSALTNTLMQANVQGYHNSQQARSSSPYDGSSDGNSKRDVSHVLETAVDSKPATVVGKKSETLQTKKAVRTCDIYEPGFSYPNSLICPNDGIDIRLVILITSAPGHFHARDAIRLTWGHYAQRLDVSMAFLIGRSQNESVLEGIEMEKRLYDDLIVANFMDSYDNLTLKTMSTLEWIESYCNQSDFVLKTDDDMFINVPNLLNFINRIEDGDRKQPKFYGRLAKKWKPVRNKKSKYYISFKQYRKAIYPDFTTGPAYLFSSRISSSVFETEHFQPQEGKVSWLSLAFDIHHAISVAPPVTMIQVVGAAMEKTYLKLEDVFTTGIVAQDLKIKRINVGDFANKKVNLKKTGYCALSKLISMHMVAYHEQFEIWKRILDRRTKCKIIYTSKNKSKMKTSSPPSISSNNHSNSNNVNSNVNSNSNNINSNNNDNVNNHIDNHSNNNYNNNISNDMVNNNLNGISNLVGSNDVNLNSGIRYSRSSNDYMNPNQPGDGSGRELVVGALSSSMEFRNASSGLGNGVSGTGSASLISPSSSATLSSQQK